MTRNKLRRAHNDPLWSGRLVEGTDGGWLEEDCTLGHLHSHVWAAKELILDLWDKQTKTSSGRDVLTTKDAGKAARLFELVDNLQRVLPLVDGWCCGYAVPGGRVILGPKGWMETDPFEVRSAHRTETEATTWLEVWKWHKPDHLWEVRRTPAPIIQFRHPDADPERFVAEEAW